MILNYYSQKFTVGEACLLGQLLLSFISWGREALNLSEGEDLIFQISKLTLSLTVLTVFIILFIGNIDSLSESLKFYLSIAVTLKINLLGIIYFLRQRNLQLKNLTDQLTKDGFWQYILIEGVLIMVPLLLTNILSSRKLLRQIVLRKLFHFQLTIIIFVGLSMSVGLTLYAISVGMWIFGILEVFRQVYQQSVPFLFKVTNFMLKFVDYRDDSQLIITHLYLLMGVSIGIFRVYFDENGCEKMAATVGLVVLGIGDSFAAIVGSKWGRIKILGTKKTLEGFISFIISGILFLWWISNYTSYMENKCDSLDINVILSLVVVAILEVFTFQIDNLLLPQIASLFALYH